MDGKRFLGTARFLQSRGADEAAYRSAVSRAYYACFLETRRVAFANCPQEARRKAGIKSARKILHESLQRYLKNGATEAVRQLGEDLAGLCGKRGDADYNMDAVLSAADAKDAVEEAQAFLNEFSRTDPVAVGEAMEAYIDATYRG